MGFFSLGLNRPESEEERALERKRKLEQARKDGYIIGGPDDASTWKPWRTVVLGRFPTGAAYQAALEAGGFCVLDDAAHMLQKMPVAKAPIEVNLYETLPGLLGLPKEAYRGDLYDRAEERGLLLCPAEVGAALRLDFANRWSGSEMLIAMKPIADRAGRPSIFSLRRSDTSSLTWREFDAEPQDCQILASPLADDLNWLDPNRSWVFMLPRPK